MAKIQFHFLAASVLLSFATLANAQDWARTMFETPSHDFGHVARGAKAEYHFKIHNPYRDDVHIASVRTSCGCTTPKILKDTLKAREDGAIVAVFNTRTFQGHRHATITVRIDKPLVAEVQLQINGFIDRDIVFEPGQVEFSPVDQGTPAEKRLTISHSGKSDWRILAVKSGSSYLETTLTEKKRAGDQVTYDLLVRLREDAPAGAINEELTLVTNEQRASEVPLAVAGRVVSELTVSPASLALGVAQPGQRSTRQLVVKGKKPFHITAIECDDPAFEIPVPTSCEAMHVVPITFVAGDVPGKVSRTIRIRTDLGENIVAEFSAYAQIISPDKQVAVGK